MSADDSPSLASSRIAAGRTDLVFVVVDRWIVRRILITDGCIGQHPRYCECTNEGPQQLC